MAKQPPTLHYDIPALMKALAATPLSSGPTSQVNLANFILRNSNPNWDRAAQTKLPGDDSGGPPGPSVLSRIMDVLSRGQYASAEGARQLLMKAEPGQSEASQIGDVLHGVVSGVAGTRKTSYSDVLREMEYNQALDRNDPNGQPTSNPAAWQKPGKPNDYKKLAGNVDSPGLNASNGIMGLLGDIFLDPTTYIGPGAVKGGLRLGGKVLGIDALKGIGKAKEFPKEAGKLSIAGTTPGANVQANGIVNVLGNKNNPLSLGLKTPGAPTLPVGSAGKQTLPAGLKGVPQTQVPTINFPKVTGPSTKLTNPTVAATIPAHIVRYIDQSQVVGLTVPQVKQRIKEFAAQFPYKLPELRGTARLNKTRQADLLAELQKKYGTEAAARTNLAPPVTGPPPVAKGKGITAAQMATGGNVNEAFNLSKVAINAAARDVAEKSAAKNAAQGYIDNTLKNPKFGKAGVYGPAKQANFFQNKLLNGDLAAAPQLLKAAGIAKPHAVKLQARRFASAYRMLKQAEDHMIAQGIHPTFLDGSHLRLSEVIDKVGGPSKVTKELYTVLMKVFKNGTPLEKIDNLEVRHAIQSLQAGDALKNAPLVDVAVKQVNQQASVASQVLSDAKFQQWQTSAVAQYNKAKVAQQAMSPQAQKATATILQQTFKQMQGPSQHVISGQSRIIQRYMTPGVKGVKWAPAGLAQTNAIARQLGGQTPAQLGRIVGPMAKAQDFLGAHFATWYGQKDLRPDALNFISSAINTANVRATKWNGVSKSFTEQQRLDAFKAAQGRKPTADPSLAPLIGNFQRSLDDLFKASGLSEEATKASSAALRSGLLLADINKQLKIARSDFRFTNGAKVIDPFDGTVHNFSKGTDWLTSWRLADVADPLDFMMKVETATEQVMHQYAYMDELVARFGSTTRSNVFSESVGKVLPRTSAKTGKTLSGVNITGIGRLHGVYFPRELAPQIQKVFETWSQVYDPKSPLTKFLDRVVSSWKSGVTIYAPSHHIRNYTGDVYLSWMAGVNNPAVYNKARKVLFSERAKYKDGLVPLEQLISKNAINDAMTRPGDVVLKTRGGIDLTAEQVYIAAHKTGLLTHAKALEDIVGDPLIKVKPLGGHVQKFAQSASEVREHHVRLAHFIDTLQKSNEKDLSRLFADSAKVVRKWHPDGLDLTKFEREKMRRLAPFYSWTRKSIPLLIESALTRPGKVVAYNKGMYGLQQSLGIESDSAANPFPSDQLFPSWLKAKDIGPLFGSGQDDNYTIANPSNPFNDLVAQFGGMGSPQDTLQGMGSMLNPVAKIPAELMTGNTMLGVPVSYDPQRYATEQIPLLANASRMSNIGIGGVTVKGEKQGVGNMSAIANFLFALGLSPTGQYIKQSRFEERAANKKAGG